VRILVVSIRIPYPPTDGGAIATLELMRGLAQAGHELTLCALNTNKHRQDPAVMAPIARTFATDINTDIRPLALAANVLWGSLPYNVARFWSALHAQLVGQVLCEEGPFDVVQLESAYAGLYLSAIRQATKAPVVLRAHNVEFEIWRRMASHEPQWAKRRFYGHLAHRIERFERQLVTQIDGLAAITERDLHTLRQMGFRGQGLYLPAGCQIAATPATATDTFRKLGFIGSMDWLPNVQGIRWFLADVWPLVNTALPNLQFHLAGKHMPPDLLALRMPGVVVHGEVPDAQAFLHSLDAVACPLLSGGGMRLKVVEAMGQGKCVLATDVGAEGIGAQPNLHYLRAESPVEWLTTLQQLDQKPHALAEIGQQAHAFARAHYGWPALTDKLVAYYTQLSAQTQS